MATSVNPRQVLDSYRKSDAVFIVCQNNDKKMLEIAALNDEAVRITGYSNDEMVGHPLSLILPERISSIIDEFIEYEENKSDLLSVLSKVRDFAIRTRDGREVKFKLRIISGESFDRNPWFHLVLIDEQKVRDANAFRAIIKENFKGHEVIDPRTELPDRSSMIKDIELVIYYVRDKNIFASFAVVDINDYERLKTEYGQEICDRLHQHISRIFKQKLRAEDTVGTLSECSMGIILVGASQEEARMVLNRLRWAIGVSPMQVYGEELTAQVNICFTQIDGKISNVELLRKCEEYMKEQSAEVENSLQLVITHDRRGEIPDRRKKSVPVTHERRIKERRVKKWQER